MLIEKVDRDIERRRVVLIPQHANRASSIGYPCIRFLVYSIVRWEDRAVPEHNLQIVFDEGTKQEKILRMDLEAAGVVIEQTQREVSFPKYRLYGHIDGIVKYRGSRLLEIKTMSDHIFNRIDYLDDFLHSSFAYHQCYPYQVNVYLKGLGLKRGLFVIKNKNNGRLKELPFDYDKRLFNAAVERCVTVNTHVDVIKELLRDQYDIEEIADFSKRQDALDVMELRNEACRMIDSLLPPRITNLSICENCQFNHICLPDEIRQEQCRIYTETDEFISKLIRRSELEESRTEYESLDTEIKDALKGRGDDHFFLGTSSGQIPFEITIKPHGKGQRVDITRLEE